MHALISGGNGVIGKSLIPLLLDKGVKLTSLIRPNSQIKNKHPNISYISQSICLDNSIDADVFSRFDCFIDLAWEDVRNVDSQNHLDFNLRAHKDFISKIVNLGVKNIFVLGSCYEYGLQQGQLSESSDLIPVTKYGQAKKLLLQYLMELKHFKQCNLIWGRLFYIYGAGQPEDTFYGQLENAISNNLSVFEIQSANKYLDYLKLCEAVKSMSKLILNFKNYGVVNICSGKPTSLQDLAASIIGEFDSNIIVKVVNEKNRQHEPNQFWGDASYLHSILEAIHE